MTQKFDRFADWVEGWVSSAPYFVACVLIVVIWAPSIFIIRNLDTWQLIINTMTTIITFLMVALLENTTRRFEISVHKKLDCILDLLGEIEETDTKKAQRTKGIEKEVTSKDE